MIFLHSRFPFFVLGCFAFIFLVLLVACLIIDFALLVYFHSQLFDASASSSITIDAMHPSNKKHLGTKLKYAT
jgi:hypothetical protein